MAGASIAVQLMGTDETVRRIALAKCSRPFRTVEPAAAQQAGHLDLSLDVVDVDRPDIRLLGHQHETESRKREAILYADARSTLKGGPLQDRRRGVQPVAAESGDELWRHAIPIPKIHDLECMDVPCEHEL